MRKGILVTLFVISWSILGISQNNQDFILTLHKDTIFGKVKVYPQEEYIIFTHRRKKIYFHPKTLQAFGIYNKDKTYTLYKSIINARGNSIFVEIINEGPVKLYKYNRKKEEAISRYFKDLYFIGKSDTKLSTMTPETYTRTMRVLVKDYPNLLNKVEKISYHEVPQMVELYNQLR